MDFLNHFCWNYFLLLLFSMHSNFEKLFGLPKYKWCMFATYLVCIKIVLQCLRQEWIDFLAYVISFLSASFIFTLRSIRQIFFSKEYVFLWMISAVKWKYANRKMLCIRLPVLQYFKHFLTFLYTCPSFSWNRKISFFYWQVP